MIIKLKEGQVLFTEIQNINGSLDEDLKLKEQFLKNEYKELGFDFFKSVYGVLVKDMKGSFMVDFSSNKSQNRHSGLVEMFEEDRKTSEKFNRRMSIFLIKVL